MTRRSQLKPERSRARLYCRQLSVAVRGPWFLSLLSVVLLLTIPAAQATLLKGYLWTDVTPPLSSDEQNKFQPSASDPDPAAPHGSPTKEMADQAHGAQYGPSAAAARPVNIGQGGLLPGNSFPVSFTGSWKCLTVVIGSALPSVPVGQRVESEVDFAAQSDGRVLARWQQPGWTEARQKVVPVSETEASLDRTNYYMEQGQYSQWAAHSLDHYIKLDQNHMSADSRVDQFVAGRFVGQYETRSFLTRLDQPVALAN